MVSKDPLDTVTIYKGGFVGLYADRLAVTVRSGQGGRFEWAEISRFAEQWLEAADDPKTPQETWQLVIVLRSGRQVPVRIPPNPQTLAAIREVAERHGIPIHIPVGEGSWKHAAVQARNWTAQCAVSAVVSAALLAFWLATELGWVRNIYLQHKGSGALGGAALAALYAFIAWRKRKYFQKLDRPAGTFGDAAQ